MIDLLHYPLNLLVAWLCAGTVVCLLWFMVADGWSQSRNRWPDC